VRVVGRPPFEHLADRQKLLHGRFLQDYPDAFEHAPAVVPGIEPEHAHIAGTGGLVALQYLHDRRLARTVGTEQGEDLTTLNFEIHSADRLDGSEVLAEPTHRDRQSMPQKLMELDRAEFVHVPGRRCPGRLTECAFRQDRTTQVSS